MIKHGLIKLGLIKHGLRKHGLIKHGLIKHGLIKHGLIKHGLIKDVLKLSHTLGHVSELAPLQPSQILSYPFNPKQAFLTLIKKTHHNADKGKFTEKTKKLKSLFSRNKLKI